MRVYYFTAPWCLPCRAFKPVVIQTSIDTGIPVNFVDVDQNKELAQKFQVTSVPTLIVSDALGNVVKRSVGAMPKTALAQFLGSAK